MDMVAPLGKRLGTLGRFSFLERQLLIAFCCVHYAHNSTHSGKR
jgi:hypothetical protein